MGYNIEKDFIPGLPSTPLKETKLVVAHEAGNPNNTGPNALNNEIKYMKQNWQRAFVSHWVGGGGRIVQLAPTGKVQYGAGYYANQISYAHVELARTDDLAQFKKDYDAYVWLLRKLAQEAGIPVTLDSSAGKGIKTHLWVTNNLGGTTHVDPYGYLAKFGVSAEQFKKDVEGGKPSSKPSTSNNNPNTGTVTVKRNATHFATGERIADFVKGNSYEVIQEKSDRVLLSPIMSWVKKSDIVGNNKPSNKPGISGKVVLKNSAKKYATGENIPNGLKGKTYTVMQEETNKVLLKELYSWVNKSDVTTSNEREYQVGDKVSIRPGAKKYATGQFIPGWVKNKTYTIQQVKSNRVLLKEILSWVYKSDLN